MEQPPSYVQNDSFLVYRQNLYGFKQAPHAWYAKWTTFFLIPTFLDVVITLMSIPRN
jgi:hypothetical protein